MRFEELAVAIELDSLAIKKSNMAHIYDSENPIGYSISLCGSLNNMASNIFDVYPQTDESICKRCLRSKAKIIKKEATY